MEGSGLGEMLSLVYAENSVKHILSGHAYERAIRGHYLVYTAIAKLVLKDIEISEDEKICFLKLQNFLVRNHF